MRWVGKGQVVSIAGLQLRDPLVYTADSRARVNQAEPAAIDVALPVAARANVATERELPYWPSYGGLAPAQRRYYLEWLATGRMQLPRELGYTFLFLYGLERRTLADQADLGVVFDEVIRLRALYAAAGEGRGSFDSYTGSFLWFLLLRHGELAEPKRVQKLITSTHSWSEDQLAALVYSYTSGQKALPPWCAYLVADSLPQAQRSVVLKRVPQQFRELFEKRYRDRFGAGLQVKVSKRKRVYNYRPSSGALKEMQVSILDPLGAMSQYTPLAEIWNACIQDLRKLGSVVLTQGHNAMTVAQWDAMPPEIRAGVDHPMTESFCQLVERHNQSGQHAQVPASEMARLFGLSEPERPTLIQSRQICQTASHIGYGMEPDARLTNKAYRNGQPLAVFLQLADDGVDPVRYNAAACMLHFGMMVAASDGTIHESELAAITHHIEKCFGLREDERRRMEALRQILAKQGSDKATLMRLARELAVPQRQAVGKLLIALIAADGVVTEEELVAVRACYKILGLDIREIQASLVAIGAVPATDEPVIVRPGTPGSAGEVIPHAPAAGGLRLNRQAIDAIMRDTQEVAQLLAQAMTVQSDEPVPAATPDISAPDGGGATTVVVDAPSASTATVSSTDVSGSVPPRYAALHALLIGQASWPLKEAEQLARQHQLMLAGAIDALNEWAVEKHGGTLYYEDGDQLMVERDLLL